MVKFDWETKGLYVTIGLLVVVGIDELLNEGVVDDDTDTDTDTDTDSLIVSYPELLIIALVDTIGELLITEEIEGFTLDDI